MFKSHDISLSWVSVERAVDCSAWRRPMRWPLVPVVMPAMPAGHTHGGPAVLVPVVMPAMLAMLCLL